MEVLRYDYRIPFLCDPPLSKVPISMPSYHPSSTKGVALGEVTQALVAKSAVELAPLPSPSFYSRLFIVWKTSGSWRPVIDLSILNLFVDVSHFCMATIQSVRTTGWPPSTSRKPTCRSLSIRTLGASFGLWLRARFTSSLPCASASSRLLRSSHGSWLLFPPFSILGVST